MLYLSKPILINIDVQETNEKKITKQKFIFDYIVRRMSLINLANKVNFIIIMDMIM